MLGDGSASWRIYFFDFLAGSGLAYLNDVLHAVHQETDALFAVVKGRFGVGNMAAQFAEALGQFIAVRGDAFKALHYILGLFVELYVLEPMSDGRDRQGKCVGRHQKYFLGPGIAWYIRIFDVIDYLVVDGLSRHIHQSQVSRAF